MFDVYSCPRVVHSNRVIIGLEKIPSNRFGQRSRSEADERLVAGTAIEHLFLGAFRAPTRIARKVFL